MHILYFGCLATELLNFFINAQLYVAMITKLVKDIPQNVSLCVVGCN